MASLTLTSGPLAGHRIEIIREVVVGREGADVTVEDPEVSRRHVAFRPHDGGVQVEDLDSTNGTIVDGARISAPVTLTRDASVRVGATEIQVHVEVGDRGSGTRVAQSPADATRLRGAPPTSEAPAAAPAPAVAAQSAQRPPAAPFQPPAATLRPRRRGAATRQWVPTAMTVSTVAGTAAALIVYFGGR